MFSSWANYLPIRIFFLLLIYILFCLWNSCDYAEIVTGVVSNVVSALLKWLWSLKSTAKPGRDLPLSFHFPVSHVTLFVFLNKLTMIFCGKLLISQCNTFAPWWNLRVATQWTQYLMEVSLELSLTQLKYLQMVNIWCWILRTVTSMRFQAQWLVVSFLYWNYLSLIMSLLNFPLFFLLFLVDILISVYRRFWCFNIVPKY